MFFRHFSFRLGAWQFLADMPYDSVSTETVWKIFWNIYCKPSTDSLVMSGCYGNNTGVSRDNQREMSPCSVPDIQEAMKGYYCTCTCRSPCIYMRHTVIIRTLPYLFDLRRHFLIITESEVPTFLEVE